MGKRGTGSTPKMVLTIGHNAWSVQVAGKAGKRCTVANENVRLFVSEESFASAVESAIDEIDESNDSTIECLDIPSDVNNTVNVSDESNSDQPYDADFSELSIAELSPNDSDPIGKDNNPDFSTVNCGDRIKIFWPDGGQYYSGTVGALTSRWVNNDTL